MGIVMDGKHAVTHYKVLRRLKKVLLILSVSLKQEEPIRFVSIWHRSSILYSEMMYTDQRNSKYTLEGQCLHAKVLGFVHPRTGEYMEFEVPLPEYFENY